MTQDEKEDAILEVLKEYFDCGNTYGYKAAEKIIEVLKTENFEDTVSRTEILQKYEKYCEDNCQYSKKQRDVMCGACMMGDAIEIVESLPPVTPKQRTGKWIRHTRVKNVYDIAGVKIWGIEHQCNQCTFTTIATEDFGYYDYCPNCGAKMEGESE